MVYYDWCIIKRVLVMNLSQSDVTPIIINKANNCFKKLKND